MKYLSHFFFLFNLFLFITFLTFGNLRAGDIVITGQLISESTGKPVAYANVLIKETGEGIASSSDGKFHLKVMSFPVNLQISHVGFEELILTVSTPELGIIYLTPKTIIGEEVLVLATRAIEGETPVAFSTLTEEDIKAYYTVEDVPMVLSMEPGVYAYSESGNGTGYSYVSIRGFDQSRIAVMLDNVPLNDNESHQVYWVDHGDILSDAKDVQIQRGIGNSLYGSAAFGGSINVITKIFSEKPTLSASVGSGSYNTTKLRLKVCSGKLLGKNLSFTSRISQIKSQGYRDHHASKQKALFFGLEHRGKKITNQFRTLIGYENTQLAWDGIYADDINDRKKRREGYKAYTDDFLQQIYSLNTQYRFGENFYLNNVTYLVKGKGYYKNFVMGKDFYSYSLDIYDQYSDSVEQELSTDMLRRRWIVNAYYGIIPTLTWIKSPFRIDIGGEIRSYTGDHFGEVTDFSDSALASIMDNRWYEYYRYVGEKTSATIFAHLSYKPTNWLRLIGDLQYQFHHWTLDQEKIGHAVGHKISADWKFLNPRMGTIFSLTDNLSIFVNYGKAQKEPADDQIINADDVWSEPRMAAAEIIQDYEMGWNYRTDKLSTNLNIYRIDYKNEQLKNIDIEQEGEYDYYSADATIHQGIEFALNYYISSKLTINLNGSLSEHKFTKGLTEKSLIPNVPSTLINGSIRVKPFNRLNIFSNFRYVGKQFIDMINICKIDPFLLLDVGARYKYSGIEVSIKINNLLDRLYSTYGYSWYDGNIHHAYYWPGATRNCFFTLSYSL